MNATAKKPTAKVTAKVTATAKNNVVKVSEWKTNVLNVNKDFKQCLRSTGKAIKLLLASDVLTPKQKVFFKNLQKNDELYQAFDASVKRNKNNEISVFEVLKAFHRLTK
jgi:hypothetical protein